MHAYLVVGTDETAIDKEVKSLLKRTASILLEFPISKIDDTRELAKFLKLSVNKKTAVFVKDIDKATKESLNAFLKSLEEPQKNVTYILTARSEHGVIPTILSRCLVIRTGSQNKKVTKDIADAFIKSSLPDKLLEVSKIKARDDAIIFMQDLLSSLHRHLISGGNSKPIAKTLKRAQITLRALNANGNVTLHLANFVINN